ncbi:DUF302 domain-containing protein [Methylovirgula sp. 4M-Z18]|uniref:DUF302 domain-containing protein n=1 Tax=Methylovirgula sp. 4M-Z18 TaxID=2293567 RepID=UPI0018F31C19|nr:DUF302 domain-containing protein [Methylovirgula sp. 4M-Z18]
MIPDGLLVYESPHTAAEAMARLIGAITAHGMDVMARIDHAKAAKDVGLDLRPTEVVLFGNPKAGTGLMQASETMGIDLPLRALVWQSDDGTTRLAFADPDWLAARHGAKEANGPRLAAMRDALAKLAAAATG